VDKKSRADINRTYARLKIRLISHGLLYSYPIYPPKPELEDKETARPIGGRQHVEGIVSRIVVLVGWIVKTLSMHGLSEDLLYSTVVIKRTTNNLGRNTDRTI
jgi:hypothetical protein